ncbi:MAG: DHH family phosphoesterase [Candidatus Woesearchaeota archaeon]
MLSEKEIKLIKKELEECKNPIFFFHDDADGLCSFLLLRKYKGEGDWKIVKSTPVIEGSFAKFVLEEHDKIFILDISIVEEEFIEKVKKDLVWIDHHTPQHVFKVKYFNPRIKNPDEYTPVSLICYDVVKENMWLGAIGSIADYCMPPFFDTFAKKYCSLVGKTKHLDKILYETKLGELIRIFNFSLKGKSSDIKKAVNIFLKLKEPEEILTPKNSDTQWVIKRYKKIKEEYDALLSRALKRKYEEVLVFIYKEEKYSFTGDIINELMYRIPNKKIYIAGREKSGYMRISLRSKKINILPVLQEAFKYVEGSGGGHPYACGATIKKKDFRRFLSIINKYTQKVL